MSFFLWLGELSLFLGRAIKTVFIPPFEFKELLKQINEMGNRSFALVGAAGLAIGVVLALQTRSTLARFGADSLLPSMIAISVVRELGPVITGLMVAGRVGAGLAAELGSMRVTEQIDALEVSANDPFRYLVVPRLLACMLVMPVLTVYCDLLAITGGFLATALSMDTTIRLYFDASMSILQYADIIPSVLKTIFFGALIGGIGCYQGYATTGGTAGVGRSATISVVLSSLTVIIADVVIVKLTQVLFGI